MKVAVVTGASGGIGQAIAVDLAEKGYYVFIHFMSNLGNAQKVLETIINAGGSAEILKADLSDALQIENMFQYVLKKFERIDVLINNAGISSESFLMLQSLEKIEQLINTNLKSIILCCKAVSKCMISQKKGRVINISSVGAVKGSSGNAVYSASKSALSGFVKSFCKEMGRYGVTVNNVLPGMIDTDILRKQNELFLSQIKKQIPLQRFGCPQDVAVLTSFLASDEAAYINGQDIVVDGGLSA